MSTNCNQDFETKPKRKERQVAIPEFLTREEGVKSHSLLFYSLATPINLSLLNLWLLLLSTWFHVPTNGTNDSHHTRHHCIVSVLVFWHFWPWFSRCWWCSTTTTTSLGSTCCLFSRTLVVVHQNVRL